MSGVPPCPSVPLVIRDVIAWHLVLAWGLRGSRAVTPVSQRATHLPTACVGLGPRMQLGEWCEAVPCPSVVSLGTALKCLGSLWAGTIDRGAALRIAWEWVSWMQAAAL